MVLPKLDEHSGNSPLQAIPKPEVIRARLVSNAQENRLLRSLFKLSRKVHLIENSKPMGVQHGR